MKTILFLTLAAGGLTLCGCDRKPDYEFHSGADGQIMWQCNRKTGEVKVFTSYTSSFEFMRGDRDFVLNRQSGQIWRYFQNDTNSFPDEGFAPLTYGNPQPLK